MQETTAPLPEPWLRGTLSDLPVLQRALLHSLEMAQEDLAKWCANLNGGELHARPFGLPSIGFQLRHIARSLDRFCCYAEGIPLRPEQLAALASEMDGEGDRLSEHGARKFLPRGIRVVSEGHPDQAIKSFLPSVLAEGGIRLLKPAADRGHDH